MKNKEKDLWITCPNCGYHNQKEMISKYGTCKLCKRVLDNKAKYKYEMYCKLHLWSKKGTGFYETSKI